MLRAALAGAAGQVGADDQDVIGPPGDDGGQALPHGDRQPPPDGQVVLGDHQARPAGPAPAQGQRGQGPGPQAVGVDDVGPPPQPAQAGQDARVPGTGPGADAQDPGARPARVGARQDLLRGQQDDVVAVGGQEAGALQDVAAHAPGGGAAHLEHP